MSSPYHRRSYQLTQNDSQDASAEQRYHTHSHNHTHTHTLSLTTTHTLLQPHTHTLSYNHTHILSYNHTHTHTHTQTLLQTHTSTLSYLPHTQRRALKYKQSTIRFTTQTLICVCVCPSDHDDEVASLASSSGNCGARSSHRLPVKDWKTSPRSSPKLKRKNKKDEIGRAHV